MHSVSLLHDLAWMMVGAAVAALVFQRIKMPPLLGYLVAGFFLGPHLGLWPAVVDINNVHELSELGVIFLMFYIGLEFDLDRLKKIFGPSLFALVLQTTFMIFIGIQAAQWMGLSQVSGFFLGGVLSISSSMVAVKLMRDRGSFQKHHCQLAVGILILEDILAILLLVVLSGVAVQGSFDWVAMAKSLLLIGVFIVAVFFVGKLSAPRIITALEKRGTSESVTLATLGLIFIVSLIADKLDFSWALGGFLAGAILSRSRLAHRIEELTEPLRDLFSAIFFVSVGMLIQPIGLWENLPAILIISVLVILGKFSSCWLGLFLSGEAPESAGRASLIKSQIGEFGFVIIALGIRHGVVPLELQSVVSGVAFITILLTPFLIRNQLSILGFVANRSPQAAKNFASLYLRWRQASALSTSKGSFISMAKKPIIRICIHFLIISAIIFSAAIISKNIPPPDFIPLTRITFQRSLFLISALFCVPFLVDTFRTINVVVLMFSDVALSKPVFQQFSKGIYRSVFNGLILLLIFFIYGSAFFTVASPYFPTGTMMGIFLILVVAIGAIFWHRLIHMHNNWELAFLSSMEQETELRISQRISAGLSKLSAQKPWKVKIESYVVPDDSTWVGKRVSEIDLRNKTGATIAGIERSGFDITDIGPQTGIYAKDHVFLLGETNQINSAKEIFMEKCEGNKPDPVFHFHFDKVIIPPFCSLIDVDIMNSNLRNQYGVTIVGIQREDERIIGPHPAEVLLEGDMLLVMGSHKELDTFKIHLQSDQIELPEED